MTTVLQAFADGVLQGGILALIAVGFTLAWGVLDIVNLAHGAFVVLGAYVAWGLSRLFGLGPAVGAVAAALVLFAVGAGLQASVLNRVARAPLVVILLVTFGLGLALTSVMEAVFSTDFRSIPTGFAVSSWRLGGVYLPVVRVVALLLGVTVASGVALVVRRSRAGLVMRAVGMDLEASRLVGVRVRRVYVLTMGAAAALAGLAGSMVASVGTFSPANSATYTLYSSVIAVIGGVGDTNGAIVGGLLFGVVQAFGNQYLPGGLPEAISFVLLIAVLLLKPSGLIGRSRFATRVDD